jgi:hypothetical protein
MLLLRIHSANESRAKIVNKFPCVIGRSPAADFVLSAPGVWERHMVIAQDADKKKFTFATESGAIVFHNNEREEKGFIRNGDLFKIGATELQISLARAEQQGLSRPEVFAWMLLALVVAVEVMLLFVLQK